MLVVLDGFVFTRSGGVLETHKRPRVSYDHGASPVVATTEYVYMALYRSSERTRSLFRYDNSHGGTDTLHRHCFDHDGNPAGVDEIAHDQLPFMDDVIREVEWLAAYVADLGST